MTMTLSSLQDYHVPVPSVSSCTPLHSVFCILSGILTEGHDEITDNENTTHEHLPLRSKSSKFHSFC
jgi:hypothetical protein